MALVCDDMKSDQTKVDGNENADLEDGEIEDDEEEEASAPPQTEKMESALATPPAPKISSLLDAPKFTAETPKHEKFVPSHGGGGKTNKFERRLGPASKHEEKKKGHLTEAERSVMYLHKLERQEREKREKYHREPDDFASNIEKTLASILKKDRTISDDEKDEEKRGKKRKKNKDKEKKKKMRRIESPRNNDDPADETEMMIMRGGSPGSKIQQHFSPHSEESPSEESDSSDRSGEEKKDKRKEKKEKRGKNRTKEKGVGRDRRSADAQVKDSMQLCVYFIQGKCQKGDECTYSHEVQPPMKWELCKFYLNDCCAKGDKCLYMHSDFPCKFYHTGQTCLEGDNCKFAHGKPLSDKLKQILFKHIETAPKDILGRFPRMSREEAAYKINHTQKGLEVKYGVEKKESNIPSLFEINVPVPPELLQDDKAKDKGEKTSRNRPTRWQDADPSENSPSVSEQRKTASSFSYKTFVPHQDQDMRISSNGDVDMRTLGPLKPSNSTYEDGRSVDLEQYKREAGYPSDPTKLDVDIRSIRGDTDIRNHSNVESMGSRDVDIRMKDVDARQVDLFIKKDIDTRSLPSTQSQSDDENESKLEIVMDDDVNKNEDKVEIPANLPKRQRELFLRIQAQQKENVLEHETNGSDNEDNNIDWYSDDSNDGRLTIEDVKEKEDDKPQLMSPANVKPAEVMEKLGDLSKIDISEEVSKLLSTIRQGNILPIVNKEDVKSKDSKHATDDNKTIRPDPRKARLQSTDEKPKEKISIYEQGSISTKDTDVDLRSLEKDLDLRPNFGTLDIRSSTSSGRSDIDLRQLSLPFKAMQNYTPATEIDASINSHLPMIWSIQIIEIPRPDYTGLKLSAQDAHATGDPRLRKIFRLDVEEKDSPASPKQSPKSSTATTVRVDPRRRKIEEPKIDSAVSYAQQMNMLQGSSFYQNLTSNQKVMLNHELATRDQVAGAPNEQILAGILNALGIVQGQSGPSNINGSVLNLLSTVANMNQQLASQNISITQPNQTAILGANPNVLGQNQGLNMLGQQVNPNIMGQNPNLMNQMAQSIVQPGLLGAAPGIPNLPPDFQINFDPRNGGLLGNAPPFVNFNAESSNFNFNEDYFPEQGNNFNTNRNDSRPYNRDRPRRGRFNRNSRNNHFRNRNRSNRSHTPP